MVGRLYYHASKGRLECEKQGVSGFLNDSHGFVLIVIIGLLVQTRRGYEHVLRQISGSRGFETLEWEVGSCMCRFIFI